MQQKVRFAWPCAGKANRGPRLKNRKSAFEYSQAMRSETEQKIGGVRGGGPLSAPLGRGGMFINKE